MLDIKLPCKRQRGRPNKRLMDAVREIMQMKNNDLLWQPMEIDKSKKKNPNIFTGQIWHAEKRANKADSDSEKKKRCHKKFWWAVGLDWELLEWRQGQYVQIGPLNLQSGQISLNRFMCCSSLRRGALEGERHSNYNMMTFNVGDFFLLSNQIFFPHGSLRVGVTPPPFQI